MKGFGGTTRWLLAGALLSSVAAPAQAADKVQAVISAGADTVTLANGFGWIDGKGEVTVVFFTKAPDAKEQERAMQSSGPIFGVFDAPNVTLDLDFEKGATQASLTSFSSCHVGFYEFKAGIWDWNSLAKACGAVELTGVLKPGAVVHGKLKGQAEKKPFFGEKKPSTIYAWDIDFTVTLRKKP